MTEPVYEEKNWGRVWHRFYDAHAGESLLDVIPGQRCSMHYHKHRWNTFIVVDAVIVVEQHGSLHDRSAHDSDSRAYSSGPYQKNPLSIKLQCGDSCTVGPRQWHLFKTVEPGRVIEVYFTTDGTPVDPDDIVRFDKGCAL